MCHSEFSSYTASSSFYILPTYLLILEEKREGFLSGSQVVPRLWVHDHVSHFYSFLVPFGCCVLMFGFRAPLSLGKVRSVRWLQENQAHSGAGDGVVLLCFGK